MALLISRPGEGRATRQGKDKKRRRKERKVGIVLLVSLLKTSHRELAWVTPRNPELSTATLSSTS